MSAPTVARPEVTLEDKYVSESGRVLLTGIQALVRLTLDQRRLDERRGLHTGVFVSGYQGSPLAGVDQAMQRERRRLDAAGVVFRSGLNEELAATAVSGTQLLGALERRRRQGVTGFWFGKSPGLDRAADAIRHGNVTGTSPTGGAVAWIGDDPSAKSSTVPSSCEPLCRSLFVPILAPGTVGEIVELGLHAVALSRHAGLWSGLKIVADIADATSVVDLDGLLDRVPTFPTREAHEPPVLLPPFNLDAELDLMTLRLDRAREYARAAGLNRVAFDPRRPRMAIVAAGVAHQAVVRALDDLGLDGDDLEHLGLRLVRLGMPWPLDRGELRAQLSGVQTVLVVEDKLAFVETQIKEALYRVPDAPLVVGKEDAEGRALLSPRSTLEADDIALALAHVLDAAELPARARARVGEIEQRRRGPQQAPAPLPARTPYFCSGCPHNVSTRAADDQLVGVGIGCHTMVALDDDGRGKLLGMPQMGGEGAQWIGLAPFTDDEHFIQNMGDGTFHHSGSLAVRAAVAAGVNVTFRLLYNDAVAMTGGQVPQGRIPIPELTRWLALEGVRRVVVTTPEPGGYSGVELDPRASVRHRDDLQDVQRELAAEPGVTVLIHDDRCATEERRMRKRGQLEAPPQRIFINERVCEGCGDCGEKSTCLSVLPVDTEFGRKTQIHQGSCNQDFTCLKGDCPSFLTVVPAKAKGKAKRRAAPRRPGEEPPPVDVCDPTLRVPDDVLVRIPGVGGTGVVTVSQILQMAAHLDGHWAAGLEQIGLAQKGGPVISDVRIASSPVAGQLRATVGRADVVLGFDLLGAAAPGTLAVADPERTVAVISTTRTPTAAMVTDTTVAFPSSRRPLGRIEAVTRAGENLYLDAQRIAEGLFHDHMSANMVLVGAAFQHGCLPLSAEAIERAIALNGAAVEENLAAFRWGRAAAVDPDAVDAAIAPPAVARAESEPPTRDPRVAALLEPTGFAGALRELVVSRTGELIAYQGVAYARAYVDEVARVAQVERERTGGSLPVTLSYARLLHKLMAYKDEYEIARLHLDPVERARIEAEFGPGAKVSIMLQPPILRALGMKRKLALGPWVRPLLGLLYRLRGLRGHWFDPFGRTTVRRTERALVGEYRELVAAALEHLRPETVAQVVAICELPDGIRGYEDIKLANVETFRTAAARGLEDLATAGDRPAPVLLPMVVSGRGS